MKKLIVAAVIAGAAALVQAGSVNWGSGALLLPNADGTPSTTKVNTSNTSSLTMYVWESFTQADVAYTSGDLYGWYTGGASSTKDPFGGTLAAIQKDATIGASATTVSVGGLISDTDGVKNGFDLEMLKAVSDVVNVPVIASGGAGCAQDFVTLFQSLPKVDAGLAASIFHFGEVRIEDLKSLLAQEGINVRR